MDKEAANRENPPSLLSTKANYPPLPKEEYFSPTRRPLAALGGGAGGGDRLKRDEWSEGAVSSLLEAYEAKWILRNRAKLKGQDWEDVSKHVSSRANCSKSPKTQTQCKNKIESMKKRYRSESAATDASSWPLFPRLDHLLRGSAGPLPPALRPPPQLLVEPPQPPPSPPQPPLLAAAAPPPPPPGIAQNSHGSNGIERPAAKAVGQLQEDGAVGAKFSDHESDKNPAAVETDSSTPALYSDGEKGPEAKARAERERKRRRRRRSSEEEGDGGRWEVAESIRWLAEAVVRSEQARTEAMRELERMRAETEAKRAEMELKRTEIIANTQLEIARLFAAPGKGDIDSSLRIGRR